MRDARRFTRHELVRSCVSYSRLLLWFSLLSRVVVFLPLARMARSPLVPRWDRSGRPSRLKRRIRLVVAFPLSFLLPLSLSTLFGVFVRSESGSNKLNKSRPRRVVVDARAGSPYKSKF